MGVLTGSMGVLTDPLAQQQILAAYQQQQSMLNELAQRQFLVPIQTSGYLYPNETKKPLSNLEWLDQRINEIRIKL